MNERIIIYLPPADGHPGADISWPEDCRQAFNRGVDRAQDWLSNAHSGWLWTSFIVERDWLPPGNQRRAFEVGFLSRVHQRLCSPLGGNHQARRTCLQL